MGRFDFFWGKNWPPSHFLDWLAAGIAQRCFSAVPVQVRDQAATMSAAEAWGYLRARSGPLVASEICLALQQRKLSHDLQGPLTSLVMDDLVSRLVESMLPGKAKADPSKRQAA